jgi:predicted Fe-Mo cluster-binding NifX family protein
MDPPDPQHETQRKEMKIAIPTANGKLSMHFGHCEVFTVLDVDPESRTIIRTSRLETPPHEPGLLPRWLAEQGATTIIAGGMGQRAQSLFTANNIEVIVGAPADEPEALTEAYLAGSLTTGANVCDH